jgi:Uma2 family endonuclease
MSTAVLPELGPEDLYEVIDGKRIAKGPQTVLAAWIAGQLGVHLANCAKGNDLGWAIVKALFDLHAPGILSRRPDVAFVSYKRWPKDRPISLTADAWDVVPNVATEVVSPSDAADEIETKVNEYFHVGVQLVWVVYPTHRKIYVHRSPTDVCLLSIADVLDGGDVVPGFRLPLAELFGDESNGQA